MTDSPDWLYANEAAELCGITPGAWRRAALDSPARAATAHVAPEEYRRNPVDGRPQWRTSAVERYRDRPAHNTVLEGQATHRAILRVSPNVGGDRSTIAERLDLHVRTVNRHLDGACACDLDRTA